MPLPPKRDPRRPLQLAVRSTRSLGIIFVGLSVLVLLPVFLLRRPGMGMMNWRMALAALVYLAPGIAYLLISVFLARGQLWAIVAGLVVASLNVLLLLFALASVGVFYFSGRFELRWMAIPLFILCVFVLALTQLIYHLARSFESLRYRDDDRGFELIMPPPVNQPIDKDLPK